MSRPTSRRPERVVAVDEVGTLLAQLTQRLSATSTNKPLSLRLCAAFSETLSTDGGSISLSLTGPERVTLCATDGQAEFLESSQDVLREGPSFEAFRTGRAVTAPTTADQVARWPLLAQMLQTSHKETALHAFPLRSDDAVLGCVLLHGELGRELSVQLEEAGVLADAIGVAVLGDLGTHSLTAESWSARDRVDQATGMVLAQLGIGPSDALAVLRAHAFAHSVTLADVSDLVLTRSLDFSDRTDDGRGSR